MIKPFSIWSIVFIAIGLLALVINWISTEIIEPVVLLGILLLFIGISFSFIAYLRREQGGMKILSAVSFFIIFFFLVWFRPFLLLHMMTWIKNI